MKTLVHQHLVAALEVERASVDAEPLGKWLLSLASTVGMRPITSPVISYSDSPGNTGFLAILGISTSHFSVHHWDCCSPPLLQFDLYSCKPFSVPTVLGEIDGFWSVQRGEVAVINRGHQYSAGLEISRVDFFEALRNTQARTENL